MDWNSIWGNTTANVLGDLIVPIIAATFTWIIAKAKFSSTSSQIRIFRRDNSEANAGDTDYLIGLAKKEVLVSSGSLDHVLSHYPKFKRLIRRKVDNDCVFRLLMPDPQNENLNTFNSYLGTDQKEKLLSDHINECLEKYKLRSKEYNVRKNNFRLRLARDSILPYKLLIIDKDEPDGLCRVEMYLVNSESGDRPTFILSKKANPEMFNIFCKQFEYAWLAVKDDWNGVENT